MVRKMSTAMSEQVLKQSLELLRVAMRFAHGEPIVPSELPLGVTMDTLESIVSAASAPEESAAEEASDADDLKHKDRKLMKGETRERP